MRAWPRRSSALCLIPVSGSIVGIGSGRPGLVSESSIRCSFTPDSNGTRNTPSVVAVDSSWRSVRKHCRAALASALAICSASRSSAPSGSITSSRCSASRRSTPVSWAWASPVRYSSASTRTLASTSAGRASNAFVITAAEATGNTPAPNASRTRSWSASACASLTCRRPSAGASRTRSRSHATKPTSPSWVARSEASACATRARVSSARRAWAAYASVRHAPNSSVASDHTRSVSRASSRS